MMENEPQWKGDVRSVLGHAAGMQNQLDGLVRRANAALAWQPPAKLPKIAVWIFPGLDTSIEEIVEFLRAAEPVCDMVWLSTGPQRIGDFYTDIIRARDAANLPSVVRIGAALSASGILGKDGKGFSDVERMAALGFGIGRAYGQTGYPVIVDFESCNILQDGIDLPTMSALMKTWPEISRIMYPTMANPSPEKFARYKQFLRACVAGGGEHVTYVDHATLERPETAEAPSTILATRALYAIAGFSQTYHGLLNLRLWGDELPKAIADVRGWINGNPIVMINDFAVDGGLPAVARLRKIYEVSDE